MTASKKLKNTAEDLKGQTKEAAGESVGNEELVAEGKADQARASVKRAAENVKDAVTE